MYSLLFSAIAVFVAFLAYLEWCSMACVYWLFVVSFIIFLISRYLIFHHTQSLYKTRFEGLLAGYTNAYGNTSSGQRFLKNQPAWYDGLFSQLLMSGHWHLALFAGAAQAVGKLFDDSTPEQAALEQRMTTIIQSSTATKEAFTTSIVVTSIVYISAVGITYFGISNTSPEIKQNALPSQISTPDPQAPLKASVVEETPISNSIPSTPPSQTTPAATLPPGDILTRDIVVQSPNGIARFKKGTRVSILNSNGSELRVSVDDIEFAVPKDALGSE